MKEFYPGNRGARYHLRGAPTLSGIASQWLKRRGKRVIQALFGETVGGGGGGYFNAKCTLYREIVTKCQICARRNGCT